MADLLDLQEVLHPKVITNMYLEPNTKFVPNPLTDFYSTGMKPLSGDRFEFAYRAAMKEPAPANFRGQPARVLQPVGIRDAKIYLLHAFNEIGLSMEALQMIRKPNDLTLQEKGREEIQHQIDAFGDRHKIFRSVCCAKTLLDKKLHFNAAGQVLESDSGAIYSVDFGYAAGHAGQLDYDGNGALIAASWATAGTKIFDHLDDIKVAAETSNAEEPTDIWVHTSMKKHLRNNTQILGFLQASPEKADRILAGSMIEDLNGWTWHFYSGTYTAQDGTTKPYLPTTKAIITPKPQSGDWLRAVNGSELITGFEGITGDVNSALANVTELFGDFAYVKLMDNPTKLVVRMGTNFVYAFANPNAVWSPTVVF